MKKETKAPLRDKLDPRVIATALIVSIMEFEVFAIPRGIVTLTQQDAWLSILLGSVISTLTTFLLVRLASRFPRENLFQYNKKIWGGPIAFVIASGYFLYWAVYMTLIFQDFNTANKLLFLRETPSAIPMLILAAGAAWLVCYGLTAVIRFFQIMLPFLILPLLFLYFISFRNIALENFLPVLGNGWLPVLKGAVIFAGLLQGLEIILFLGPFLSDTKRAVKPALTGIISVNLIALLQTTTTIGIMGSENIKHSVWPGITLMSLVELPGFPAERYELFLTAPWLVGVFTTMCIFLYLLSHGIIQVFNLKNKKGVIFILSGLIISATYFFPNYAWTLDIRKNYTISTLFFLYLLPILTLIVATLRGKRG